MECPVGEGFTRAGARFGWTEGWWRVRFVRAVTGALLIPDYENHVHAQSFVVRGSTTNSSGAPRPLLLLSLTRRRGDRKLIPQPPGKGKKMVQMATRRKTRLSTVRTLKASAFLILVVGVAAAAAADRFVYVSNGFPMGSNNVSALRI